MHGCFMAKLLESQGIKMSEFSDKTGNKLFNYSAASS